MLFIYVGIFNTSNREIKKAQQFNLNGYTVVPTVISITWHYW